MLRLFIALPAAAVCLSVPAFSGSPALTPPRADSTRAMNTAPGPARAADLLERLPLSFQAASETLYVARTPRYSLELTPAEARLYPHPSSGARTPVRIRLGGANPSPAMEAGEPHAVTSSYLQGNDKGQWRGRVHHYGRVTYRDVYPGIDLAYYGTGRNVEYDFIVSPGADPSTIRLHLDGASAVTMDSDGALRFRAGGVEFRQPRPVVWQSTGSGRSELEGNYVLAANGEIAFRIGDYDRSRTLVIDPLIYSTFLGGESRDAAFAVGVDKAGFVWVAGTTTSPNFPLVGNVLRDVPAGNSDIFLARIDPSLEGGPSLVYSTFLGGTGNEEATALAVDPRGFIVLAGWTDSTDFPMADTIRDTNAGERDAFVVQIDPNQSGEQALVYSTYLGGSGEDTARAVTVDSTGRVFVAGQTRSEDFPLAGALQGSIRGGYDGFFAVLNPQTGRQASLEYSSFLGGGGWDNIRSIAVDPSGTLVYLAGGTTSVDFPSTDDGLVAIYIDRGDAFLTKVDLSKPGLDALVYSTFIGGSDLDVATAVQWAGPDQLWVAGYTFSADYPATASVFQGSTAGDADIFVAAYDLNLPRRAELVYSTYIGGSSSDVPYAIAVDARGWVWITGYTTSRDFPTRGNAAQPNFGGGGSDAFLAVLDPQATGDASLPYASYFGGALSEASYGIALDARGNAHMAGFSLSSDLAATENAFQSSRNVFSDAYLSVFRVSSEDLAR